MPKQNRRSVERKMAEAIVLWNVSIKDFTTYFMLLCHPPLLIRLMLTALLLRASVLLSLRCDKKKETNYITRNLFYSFTIIISQNICFKIVIHIRKLNAYYHVPNYDQVLTKFQIINLFNKMQDHTNSTISRLTDEIKRLNANFKRLKSDIEVGEKNKRCSSDTSSFPTTSVLEKRPIIAKGVCGDNRILSPNYY